jgi:hypothetical protein
MTSTGKIARLPQEIRDELNRRLHDGERGRRLVDWLNRLPEAQRMLVADFGGRPINEPNLTAWKAGGYKVWLNQMEPLVQARKLLGKAGKLTSAMNGRLTDQLATLVAARYAATLVDWDGEVSDEFRRKLRLLHGLCDDMVQLRRSDLDGVRLNLEKERLAGKGDEKIKVN